MTQGTQVARPLPKLVPLITNELKLGYEAGVEHYRRAGEYLLEAREQLEESRQWQAWLKRNVTNPITGESLSPRQAGRYMTLAEKQNGRQRPFRTISEATGEKPPPAARAWVPPVREILEKPSQRYYEQLRADRQAKDKEAALERRLAKQIIDIGYKVLATKLHPDKPGGSNEAMARLNKVRKMLNAAIR